MLYFFIGDDVVKAKAEALRRAKGSEVVRFGDGAEPFMNVGGYLEQQGLFAPQVTLILDRPLDDTETKAFLIEHGREVGESDALVIAIQPDVDALTLKKIQKFAEVVVYGRSTKDKPPRPNTFALADAVVAGDRKRAWILYRSLLAEGISAEELHGALAWSARNSLQKIKARGAPGGAAETLSADLVQLYHEARTGNGTLEDLLEVYLLKK